MAHAPATGSLRLCVECVHHRFIDEPGDMHKHWCEGIHRCLVTGTPKTFACFAERSDAHPENCGPSGRFYVALQPAGKVAD